MATFPQSWINLALQQADHDRTDPSGRPAYGDVGQWDAELYRLTNDVTRATRAITKALNGINGHPPGFPMEPTWGRNELRETTIEWAVRYADLLPAMSSGNATEWRRRLDRRAELILAEPGTAGDSGGVVLSDSDLVTGTYFGLLAIDLETRTNYRNHPRALGMADALKRFCHSARGGEWIESSQYNPGTLQLLVMGHLFAPVPEVGAILPAVATQFLRTLTPGLTDYLAWGDVEGGGRWLALHNIVPLLLMLTTATEDVGGLIRTTVAWFDRDGPGPWKLGLARALRWFDPDKTPLFAAPSSVPPGPVGFRDAADVGIVTYRRGPKMVAVHAPNPLGVDHRVSSGNIWVWDGGVPVLDSPRGYGTAPEGMNTAILGGLQSLTGMMIEYGQLETIPSQEGFKAVWRTGGKYEYHRGDIPPPGVFCDEWRRVVEWDGSQSHPQPSLVVTDTFKGRQITPSDLEAYYTTPRWPDHRAEIEGRDALWVVVWQATSKPILVSSGVWEWNAADGRIVRLTASGYTGFFILDPHPVAGAPESEWSRFWQLRLLSDIEGEVTISSSLTFAVFPDPIPVPPPVIPVPVPPVPPLPPPPVPVPTPEEYILKGITVGETTIDLTNAGGAIIIRLEKKS